MFKKDWPDNFICSSLDWLTNTLLPLPEIYPLYNPKNQKDKFTVEAYISSLFLGPNHFFLQNHASPKTPQNAYKGEVIFRLKRYCGECRISSSLFVLLSPTPSVFGQVRQSTISMPVPRQYPSLSYTSIPLYTICIPQSPETTVLCFS